MLPGSSVAARNTASPRKTCVPGVHAHAVSGSNIRSANAPMMLNAKLLALPANGLAEAAELAVHEVVDRIAGGVEVVVQMLFDLLTRHTIPGVHAAVPRV